jgi:flagellar hook protein FlgE
LNSGQPTIGVPGTNGRGVIASGYLEGSNVDLAEEFTTMIITQRGYQANTKIITTVDSLLQDVVNLVR